MAKCDQGYLCDVCGEEVEAICDSDLYLRYVTGQIRPDKLPDCPERHIRCNPVVAQFIVDDSFPPIEVDGAFSKNQLDSEYVAEQQQLMTRGWQRLQELKKLSRQIPLVEYPLPEFR